MAALDYQQATVTGTTLTMAAAGASGDTIPVSGNGCLIVHNGDAAPKTVTVVVPGSQYGQARPDITKVIAAGGYAVFGPFPSDLGDPTDRLVDVTYSAVTSVTVGAISI